MTGQKGGHKDRIKTWKIIYNQRRQEKLLLQDAMMRQKKRRKAETKKIRIAISIDLERENYVVLSYVVWIVSRNFHSTSSNEGKANCIGSKTW